MVDTAAVRASHTWRTPQTLENHIHKLPITQAQKILILDYFQVKDDWVVPTLNGPRASGKTTLAIINSLSNLTEYSKSLIPTTEQEHDRYFLEELRKAAAVILDVKVIRNGNVLTTEPLGTVTFEM